MRYHEIAGSKILENFNGENISPKLLPIEPLDEYVEGNLNKPITYYDLSGAKFVGHLPTNAGQFEVVRKQDNDFVFYAAVNLDADKNLNLADPICVLGFYIKSSTILIAKNAMTDNNYQGKGIATNLFAFVNKAHKFQIISDLVLSKEGEKLWNSMARSKDFSCKILYLPTLEIFPLDQIGVAKTQDGRILKHPKQDFYDDDYYTRTNPQDQRYFFILETNSTKVKIIEGMVFNQRINFDDLRQKNPLMNYTKLPDAIE